MENQLESQNILNKKQNFFSKYKEKIIKLTIVALVVAAFSIGCFYLFSALGFLDSESKTLSIGGGWIYVIFIALFVLQAICLCVIPGNTTTFVMIAAVIFQNNLFMAFLVCIIGIWISSIALFFIGRFGGRQVLYWLFNKNAVEQKLEWVTRKGATALPAFFLLPLMPNDMICMVCGMSKLRFWQFLMIIIPFRFIEILALLSYPFIVDFFISGRPIQDVLVFINIVVIDIVLIALYYKTLIRIFRKTILRKKYVPVQKTYTVLEEVENYPKNRP